MVSSYSPTLEVVSDLGIAVSILVMIGTKAVAYFMAEGESGHAL